MSPQLKNKGFALAFSLIFFFLIISFVGVYVLATSNGLTTASRAADLKRAYYIADAGIADAFIQLRSYASAPAKFCIPAAYCNDNASSFSYALGNGKAGSYQVSASSDGAPWATYTIISKGTYNKVSKILQLSVQQTSIASLAYLSATEVNPQWGNLWWTTGMTTVGPVRTNGTLNILGNPIFDGTTIQGGNAINYFNGGPPKDNPSFVDGLTLSAASIPFLTSNFLTSMAATASAGGLVLTGASTVILNKDGSINVTNSARGWNNKNVTASSFPNGVIYVQNTNGSSNDGDVTVQGTVKGQITLASAHQMYISGNLMYNTDPVNMSNPKNPIINNSSSSTDLLGLVSQNDITVLANSAPSNIELDAVLVALNGAFQVDQWWLQGKGNMIQFGSLVNNYCGPTGEFDPGTGTLYGGYNQLQYYDTRLQTKIPPGFPKVQDSTGRTVYIKVSFHEV